MATLLLARSPGDAGFLLRTTMRLDDVAVARLRPGERVRVTLAPGTYVVQATSGGSTCAPALFTLREGETVQVVAETNLLPAALNRDRALRLRVTHHPFERSDDPTPLVRADGTDVPSRSVWRRLALLRGDSRHR